MSVASEKMTTAGDGDRQAGDVLSTWHAFLLRALAERVTAICDRLDDRWSITLREFGLLVLISDQPGQSQQAIGSRLGIDRTTVVGLMDKLEGAGLIERRRRKDDRRSYGLYLTAKGRRSLPAMEEAVAELHATFLSPLNPGERVQLQQLLSRLLTAGEPQSFRAETAALTYAGRPEAVPVTPTRTVVDARISRR